MPAGGMITGRHIVMTRQLLLLLLLQSTAAEQRAMSARPTSLERTTLPHAHTHRASGDFT